MSEDADVARDSAGPDGALRVQAPTPAPSLPGTPRGPKTDGLAPSPAKSEIASPAKPRVPTAPCREYKDLRTIAGLLEMAANYEEVGTMEELKDISAQLTVLKNCMRGLFAPWESSVTEFEKALKGWMAANEQSEKDAAKAKAAQAKAAPAKAAQAKAAQAKGPHGKKRKAGNVVMDLCMEQGTSVKTFDAKAVGWILDGGFRRRERHFRLQGHA